MTHLQATLRSDGENLDALRKAGKIPAIIYGKGVKKTLNITVDREAFKKAWASAGSSTAVTISGAEGDHDCIIHEFQIDPTNDQVIHADFLALDKNTKVTVHVELEFVGNAPGAKAGLGVFEKPIHEIQVEALPANLPKAILVDISTLAEIGSQIHIKDIKLPAGVVIVGHEPEDVVALISGIKEEVEETAPIDFASIEVEKKGKKGEEEEPAA